jgi:hypothetical protein
MKERFLFYILLDKKVKKFCETEVTVIIENLRCLSDKLIIG